MWHHAAGVAIENIRARVCNKLELTSELKVVAGFVMTFWRHVNLFVTP